MFGIPLLQKQAVVIFARSKIPNPPNSTFLSLHDSFNTDVTWTDWQWIEHDDRGRGRIFFFGGAGGGGVVAKRGLGLGLGLGLGHSCGLRVHTRMALCREVLLHLPLQPVGWFQCQSHHPNGPQSPIKVTAPPPSILSRPSFLFCLLKLVSFGFYLT